MHAYQSSTFLSDYAKYFILYYSLSNISFLVWSCDKRYSGLWTRIPCQLCAQEFFQKWLFIIEKTSRITMYNRRRTRSTPRRWSYSDTWYTREVDRTIEVNPRQSSPPVESRLNFARWLRIMQKISVIYMKIPSGQNNPIRGACDKATMVAQIGGMICIRQW